MAFALYLHIPFCVHKCSYCAFNSIPLPPGEDGVLLVTRFLWALRKEISLYADLLGRREITSIYFGGGTPTVLSPGDLNMVFELCAKSFALSQEVEITIEANPGTVDRAALKELRNIGFNRISLGAQSFQPAELELLGRIHGVREIYSSFEDSRSAGFENINLDLLYGIPGQSLERWRNTLEQALSLQPEHLSVYGLTFEEGTPLARDIASGRLQPCSEEEEVEMWEEAEELLSREGYQRYEISNYALPGRECRHNLTYWFNLSYLGLGPGAHGYLEKTRYANHQDLVTYITVVAQGKLPRAWEEHQTPEQERLDTIIMGMRLKKGLSRKVFQQRFQISLDQLYGAQLEELKKQGLIDDDGENVFLTNRGRLLANYVLVHFI
jgi:oxygen-independent coproporphyrinogen-3 oxidase